MATLREALGHELSQVQRENGDAAADVTAHEVGVEHGGAHRRADRGTLAGVQVGQAGDVEHAGKAGDLAALVERGGLDPAPG
ncbi:hypothetical protein J2S57_006178 [Kineosporia succinea]|uniref:Uncharacterized protein n=1 Tax=Kineosporia succinea TaxID=84632 RepID=A0ABT9PDF5_9ACTN|nr:hypothetical protein [Kineosporia succinea]MDP9830429.1 hypothetical protein [Kineosporia succinea]